MAQWGVVTFGRGVDRALATAALTEKLRARGIKLADFREEAFALGQGWLASDCPEAEVVLLREVSKLELSGGGHDAALRQALALPDGKVVVLCTRAERLPEVVDRYAPPTPDGTCRSIHGTVAPALGASSGLVAGAATGSSSGRRLSSSRRRSPARRPTYDCAELEPVGRGLRSGLNVLLSRGPG